MSEAEIQGHVLLGIGATPHGRFFRNTVGFGHQGDVVARRPGPFTLKPGDIVLRNSRPVTFGLCPGSSDIIGWRSLQVTPEMVGSTVALFSALEVKTATGRSSDQQDRFIRAVLSAGGIAGVVRGINDAKLLLTFP